MGNDLCKRMLTVPINVTLVGIKGAGKETVRETLGFESVLTNMRPSSFTDLGFNIDVMQYDDTTSLRFFNVWDLETRQSSWHYWHNNHDSRAIILVVDASDRDSLEEAHRVLRDHLVTLLMPQNTYLVILANKADKDDALLDTKQMAKILELRMLPFRGWHIQETIATDGYGIHAGLDWMVRIIKNP